MDLQFCIFLFLISISAVFCDECQDVTLTEYRGTISPRPSEENPGEYRHNEDCSWIITAPAGYFVRLSFPKFDVVSPFWNCEHDYIIVTYGVNKFEKYCNHNKPAAYKTSDSTEMTIQFVSDKFFGNGEGFTAKYEIVDGNGKPLAGEETPEEDDDDTWDWDDETTESTTTSTTTPTVPTTTSTTTTSSPKTAVPATTLTTTTTGTTSTTLLSKIVASTANSHRGDVAGSLQNTDDNGITNNAGAMSGAVIGGIIGVVLIVFFVLLIVAFVHWKRQKNKRIDLSTVDTRDSKTLIKDGKKYQKIVRIPESETFPL